ncbi:Protein of unknown function DUF3468 [Paramyrothecium foliicola]|nr:Protein of unknown function DUF3468 [Paramyrothecium foliicola]
MSSNNFSFVSCQPQKKPSAAVMRAIRSHSMKGKNKRADSRRSKQQAKREALEGAKKDATIITSRSISFQLDAVLERHFATIKLSESAQDHGCELAAPRALPLLVQLHPSIIQMAKNAQKSPEVFLQQLTLFSRVTTTASSVEYFVDFIYANHAPLLPLDDELVAGILFFNSFMHDLGRQTPMTSLTRLYLDKTLGLVNKKLTEGNAHLQDSTIQAIFLLAISAGSTGDVNALEAHMSGLQKIFRLRRQSQGFSPLSKVQFIAEAMDLAWTMRFGGKPYFLDSIYHDRYIFSDPAGTQELSPPRRNAAAVAARIRRLNACRALHAAARRLLAATGTYDEWLAALYAENAARAAEIALRRAARR